jgi:hypothetical protein
MNIVITINKENLVLTPRDIHCLYIQIIDKIDIENKKDIIMDLNKKEIIVKKNEISLVLYELYVALKLLEGKK